MLPWVHIHSSPSGVAGPCCIAESVCREGVGDTREQSLMEVVNSTQMNQLRKDMLNRVPNPDCAKCYIHEEKGVGSSRLTANKEFAEFYDEAMANTNTDGSLKEFKMRYFDIRFSNICNFKCRTCGAGYSSQWEQEDLKSKVLYARVFPKNDNPKFLQEVVDQVPNFHTAYFAGGEPLITEEHYILLEEMIRTKKSDDVILRYNTNMSNFKFKDKDIISLWKHFKRRINIQASIDHYGERAEYIRHGTDWATVEENLVIARNTPNITLQMNTVLSVFNFLTIGEFYKYIIDKNLYTPTDYNYTLYNMVTPEYFTCHILPLTYKLKGQKSIQYALALLRQHNFKARASQQLSEALLWAMQDNPWVKYGDKFKQEIQRVDELRGEDFRKTFPELSGLLDI